MCENEKETPRPTKAAMKIVEEWNEAGCGEHGADDMGSYTGMACDGSAPQQDADDL